MNDDLEKDVVNQEDDNNQSEEKKSFTLEEVEEIKAQMKAENEAKFDEKFNKRWSNEQRKLARDNAEKDELIELLKTQTKKDSIKELLDLSYEQYGVERPNTSNQKDEEILGKYDAKEILDLDDEAIQEEANRLAGLKKRTAREQATFMELGSYLTSKKSEAKRNQEIKEAGIDENIMSNQDFKDFMSKFNENTPLKEIYDIYSNTHDTKKQKPFSAGSLKDKKVKEDSEYFTEEEFRALTAEDLKNPKIYDKAMKSRLLFK